MPAEKEAPRGCRGCCRRSCSRRTGRRGANGSSSRNSDGAVPSMIASWRAFWKASWRSRARRTGAMRIGRSNAPTRPSPPCWTTVWRKPLDRSNAAFAATRRRISSNTSVSHCRPASSRRPSSAYMNLLNDIMGPSPTRSPNPKAAVPPSATRLPGAVPMPA